MTTDEDIPSAVTAVLARPLAVAASGAIADIVVANVVVAAVDVAVVVVAAPTIAPLVLLDAAVGVIMYVRIV